MRGVVLDRTDFTNVLETTPVPSTRLAEYKRTFFTGLKNAFQRDNYVTTRLCYFCFLPSHDVHEKRQCNGVKV